MKILLTGGLGYIGTTLINKLTKHQLIICSKNKKNNLQNFNHVTFEFVNIKSDDFLEIVKKHKPDLLIHLASITGLKNCENNPSEAFETNVYGTFNVVKACELNKIKLIFFSSREVYGKTLDVESKEKDPLLPTNVYGITKMLGESIVKNSGKNNNLKYIILRLTNVYGPRGNEKGPNKIIKNAVKNKKIEIYGGKQTINFIYIDDVVDLISVLIDKNHISQEIFNVGSKNNLSINDFSKLVEQSLDFDITIKHMPKQNVENSVFKPDVNKIEEVLEFITKTEINEGLKKTINWYFKEKEMK
jgi:nucleoside-diphosphate-sugar epimerase|tara:strand:+ start:78 stop:983 length:906 start_codon:yes stop_codon:yes gene_type:complete